ncbi:MAG: sodium:calcium antiporter [Nitrospirota bacterium]|nr:sodium:calcium antiporter [Nitrospirota bacterium]
MHWLMFVLSATVIVVAGTKLSQYGDLIAEHSGLGRLWIGVVLLAGATSLPESFTAVSAVLIDAPNIAVGDLFGAGLTNMLTLALIDLAYREKRVWQQAALEQALIATLAIILTGLAGLLIIVRQPIPIEGIGLGTIAIAAIYVFGMRVVFRQEDMRRREKERERIVEAEAPRGAASANALRRASIGFAVAALALLAAAPLLAEAAKEIAVTTGISATFIGTSLVAITTSLPELVTSFAAVRLGALDLAVGNLFGSNAINMAVLLLADAAYRQGPLLASIETTHVATALLSILLMSVGLMGIIYRAEKRFLLIEPDSVLMIVGYLSGMWLLFRIGG